MTLIDRVPVPDDLAADDRVTAIRSEITEVTPEMLARADVIFHLAGVVSGAAEANFDLGLRTNLRRAARRPLEHARRQAGRAAGGRLPELGRGVRKPRGAQTGARPAIVGDDTLPQPQSSYGTQKFIARAAQFADYTRKGFARGRSVRLMTVAVRAGQAERGRVELRVRDHPRASGRAAGARARSRPTPRSRWPRRPGPWKGILRAAAVTDADWGAPADRDDPARADHDSRATWRPRWTG